MSVEWDVEGVGQFTTGPPERTHTFAATGTYFPTVRVAAQRDGDASTPFARIQNLARARVVVS